MKLAKLMIFAYLLTGACIATAADNPSCKNVRFVDLGWTDNIARTAIASVLLEALGYSTSISYVTLDQAYDGLDKGLFDAYMGYTNLFLPATQALLTKGTVSTENTPNMEGAHFTVAVPTRLYQSGLRTFDDLPNFKDQLGRKIYGLEKGSVANALLHKLKEDKKFGLEEFEIVESTEQEMLKEVKAKFTEGKAVAFIGWEPHPMNVDMQISYLTGSGTDLDIGIDGMKTYTSFSKTFMRNCPNASRLIKNLRFTTDEISEMMIPLLKVQAPKVAAAEQLRRKGNTPAAWTQGVKTLNGQDASTQLNKWLRQK